MKKIISLLLTAVMVLSLVPFSLLSASAAETDEQGIQYTLSDDEGYYIVTDYTGTPTEVVIPSEFKGLPVKEIGNKAFFECSSLTAIELTESLTAIGDYAFFSCSSLKSIEIPNTVSDIGLQVFNRCLVLEEANIPTALTEISDYMFSITNLTSIEIPDNIERIGISAFSYTPIDSIEIPDSVTIIDMYAFSNTKIKNIIIPDSVEKIGDFAFENCTDLEAIDLGASVKIIGWSAFQKCIALKSIHLPASVTSLSSRYVFNGCQNLEKLTVAPENENYYSIDNCIIEKSTKTLLYGCPNSIIPADGCVTSISSNAFCGFDNLFSIVIPIAVTTLSALCSYCPNLTDVYCEVEELPEGWIEDFLVYSNANPTIHWGYTSEKAAQDLALAISNAEALNEDDFTANQWANLKNALEEAKAFDTDGKTTAEIRITIDNLEQYFVPVPDPAYIIGDVDNSGTVDSLDYLLVKRSCFNTYTLSAEEKIRANVNGDTSIDSIDYVLVKRIAFGTYTAQ